MRIIIRRSYHKMDTSPATLEDLDKKTDQEIAVLVLSDKEAFAVLIRRYERALLRYVARLGLAGEEDRVDVVQNTFIKAYRNIVNFDTSLTFSTWLYRIAHNETISFFRSKKVRPEGNSVDNAEEFLDKIYDDGDRADIAENINKKINALHVNAALSKIDEKYRNILILRYFEDRDYAEISDILEIPSGSVATLIHRAKKQLATYVEHLHTDENKVKNSNDAESKDKKGEGKSFLRIPSLADLSQLPFIRKKSPQSPESPETSESPGGVPEEVMAADNEEEIKVEYEEKINTK